MTMQRIQQIAGSALLLFAAAVVVGALQLRYYTSLGPGPGFFSFWLGIVLAFLAIVMIAQATLEASEQTLSDFFPDRYGILRMGAIVVSLLAVTLLLERLGFCLTMFAVYLFLLRMLGRHSLATTVLCALIGSFGIYYIFVKWLKVPLPAGVLGL
jgi:putative tricarboxylic transport membrane protein